MLMEIDGWEETRKKRAQRKKEWVGAMEVTAGSEQQPAVQPGKNWATISL